MAYLSSSRRRGSICNINALTNMDSRLRGNDKSKKANFPNFATVSFAGMTDFFLQKSILIIKTPKFAKIAWVLLQRQFQFFPIFVHLEG